MALEAVLDGLYFNRDGEIQTSLSNIYTKNSIKTF